MDLFQHSKNQRDVSQGLELYHLTAGSAEKKEIENLSLMYTQSLHS
jgi:hypothetical protein